MPSAAIALIVTLIITLNEPALRDTQAVLLKLKGDDHVLAARGEHLLFVKRVPRKEILEYIYIYVFLKKKKDIDKPMYK